MRQESIELGDILCIHKLLNFWQRANVFLSKIDDPQLLWVHDDGKSGVGHSRLIHAIKVDYHVIVQRHSSHLFNRKRPSEYEGYLQNVSEKRWRGTPNLLSDSHLDIRPNRMGDLAYSDFFFCISDHDMVRTSVHDPVKMERRKRMEDVPPLHDLVDIIKKKNEKTNGYAHLSSNLELE